MAANATRWHEGRDSSSDAPFADPFRRSRYAVVSVWFPQAAIVYQRPWPGLDVSPNSNTQSGAAHDLTRDAIDQVNIGHRGHAVDGFAYSSCPRRLIGTHVQCRID
jgi:hypothetical protein